MLYNDRGMKKWQGFVLAEHGAALAEDKRKNQKVVVEKEQQTDEEISRIFEQAFRNQKPVSIQLNYKENGLYNEDTIGVIRGFEDGYVYISNDSGTEAVELSMIRNVESVVRTKWYL